MTTSGFLHKLRCPGPGWAESSSVPTHISYSTWPAIQIFFHNLVRPVRCKIIEFLEMILLMFGDCKIYLSLVKIFSILFPIKEVYFFGLVIGILFTWSDCRYLHIASEISCILNY